MKPIKGSRGNVISMTGLFVGVPAFLVGLSATAAPPGPPPPPPPAPPLGAPLRGLSSTDMAGFTAGRRIFTTPETAQEGLGPVFNGTSCVQCHQAGAPGGAATNIGVARVTRIGAMRGAAYSDLTELGGPVLQARSLREFFPGYPVRGEIVPVGTQFVSRRITTPLFGDGLIEAIPDETILAFARQSQGDGVQGTANYEFNPDTGANEVGRFGWKSQHSNLRLFAGDAYLNEMGVTNELAPSENLPQGRPIPPGADMAADPEDTSGDVDAFATYMRFLAPPAPNPATATSQRGSALFAQIRCTACHVPSMQTGFSPTPALSNQTVRLYSDLLVHHMGPVLQDRIRQGMALGDQFRTAPLWGLSARRLYLHDGRATTLDTAIRAHGGEAAVSTGRYTRMTAADRAAILAFLNGL